ncbi:hypothetical protein H7849_12880 [Alloacidobacterium dinghuense]|uniref:Uncharacterized protein n=1 Tax=Alloacidobacterium dinghuense TaxID=2763107 RepID=A0A7G8BC29_9BACT|nr:hypothetical protein [Alloacidobacterium dinghuense]QNI30099.1 hypothetical protein H7849_12880 [Alloacidobacterium dinghuense]
MSPRETVRGTQSLVHTLAGCWSRPSLLVLEIAWRWLFGAPALLLLYYEGARILAATASQIETTGIEQFSLQDPMHGAVMIADAIAVLKPPVLHTASWLFPLLAVGWAIVSGIGRNLVLRRYDSTFQMRPLPLIFLQLLRVAALGGTFVGWFLAIHWAANYALPDAEPNLVLYCALVICLSLGIFTLWALLSWIFSIAPLLVVLENCGVATSLHRSLHLGPLKGKLVEVNLVMGIIKLALIVLAMVFSATPLPFESVMQGAPLYIWWALVSLMYLAASDFFQVARLVAFIQFWRLFKGSQSNSSPTFAASK